MVIDNGNGVYTLADGSIVVLDQHNKQVLVVDPDGTIHKGSL